MSVVEATKSKASSGDTRSGRLFLLELNGDRIHAMNPDGSDRKTIVSGCHLPDGIVVDGKTIKVFNERDPGALPWESACRPQRAS